MDPPGFVCELVRSFETRMFEMGGIAMAPYTMTWD